jgi:hypothetical protein
MAALRYNVGVLVKLGRVKCLGHGILQQLVDSPER